MKNCNPATQVALATCAAVAGAEKDDLRVIEALQHRGIETVHATWNDPNVNWNSFRLVVIRSTWDYIERRDDFLAWADQLPKVLNPAPILCWNTDKRYLGDVAKAGMPVIPTHFREPGDAFDPPPTPFFIKPAILDFDIGGAERLADAIVAALEKVKEESVSKW